MRRGDATQHTGIRWLHAILILLALLASESLAGVPARSSPNVSGMYVANSASNSISVYAPGASGDVAPLRVISGPNTGISNPWSVALDQAGRVYVANSNSITVYAPGVGGPPGSPTANAAPIRAISGFSARVWGPIGLALDAAGYLYMGNFGAIRVYAPIGEGPPTSPASSTGPVREISSSLETRGVALDPAGSLYVANAMSPYRKGGGSIDIYVPGAGGRAGSAEANVATRRTINGTETGLNQPSGVALDSAGNLYVANESSITVYAPDVGGFYDSPKANVPPIRTISGANTRLINSWGVALDAAGYLYVSNATANSITVYAPGSGGPPGSSAANVAPIRTISGPRTGLSLPYLIFLRP